MFYLAEEANRISFKPHRNWVLVLSGFVVLILSPTFWSILKDIYTGNIVYNYSSYHIVYFYSFLSIKYWIIRAIVIVVSFSYSKKLCQSPWLLLLLSVIFPFLPLIILGLVDYKLNDNRLKQFVKKQRKLTRDGIKKHPHKKGELLEKFKKLLDKKVLQLIKEDKRHFLRNRYKENEITSKLELNNQLDLLEKNIDLNFFDTKDNRYDSKNINACHACGTKYLEGTKYCPDCEIVL